MKYEIHSTCQLPYEILQNVYSRYFGYRNSGTFVEVGAFDGITFGNTYGLSQAGWRGLYIEADPDSANVCRENYKDKPNITVESCAISDEEGFCKLYRGGAVSSTIYGPVAKDWGLVENYYVDVPMFKLDTILAKNNWPSLYDLLVVDVEEAELKVLNGYSISLYRPKVAIIETHAQDSSPKTNWKAKPINEYFSKNNYSLIYSDLINSIYAYNGEGV